MFSRRKPATYGKPKRKPLPHNFEPSSLEPSRPSSNNIALQSRTGATQAQDSGNHINPPGHDRSPQKLGLLSSSKTSSGNRTVSTIAGHGRTRGTSNRHESWDLSSRDEAEGDLWSNETSMKKERTVNAQPPKFMPDSSHGRRNASFTHTSTTKTTDTSTSNDLVDDTTSLNPSLSPRRALMAVSHRSAHTPSRNRAAHGQGSFPNGTEHTERSSSPTPCTPMRRKCVVKETTPHQQELWSMLLPGHTMLGPGDLSLGSSNTPSTKSARSSTPEARPTTGSKRRRRLIDKLRATVQASQSCTTTSSGLTALSDSEEEKTLDLRKASPGNVNERSLTINIIPKATYSSQRSYLAAGVLDDTSNFDVPLVDGGQKPRKRLRTETMSFNTECSESVLEGDFDGSQGNSMRTVHELREAGENVRHLNDTEALFDDIDGQSLASISLKRRRLLDLIHRLQDPAFCRLLFDQGFDNRLLAESASRGNDAIADALLAVAVLYLVATPSGRQAASKFYDLQLAGFFATSLDRDQDLIGLIRNRRSNISKQDQMDFKGFFVDELLHSPVWRSGAPMRPSMRLIALQGLEYLIRKRREVGCKTEIVPMEIIRRLVQGLLSAQRTENPGVDLLLEIRLAISILESYTISGANHNDQQWTETTLRPITTMLSWLTCMPDTGGEETQKLTLRLYLNLTNNNPRLCEVFAGHEVLRAMLSVVETHFQILSDREQRLSGSDVLDTLILALGTLINLVEWSSTVRDMMTSTNNQDDCFFGMLVKLFVARQKAVAEVYSEEETSSNVAFGYLSVLLSYLCVEKHGRQRVASHLPAGTLQALLDTVVDFLQYHRQIDDDMDQEDGETNLKASFISRLESTVIELRRMG
ncbi:MAG: hypothetical protein L6R38_003763 [Xanthoria sp. 2 TBL-2021]|nr:MAG: hypothetical protein L6R38_003763 [Xanthoria sp. 2 TBL-2021]